MVPCGSEDVDEGEAGTGNPLGDERGRGRVEDLVGDRDRSCDDDNVQEEVITPSSVSLIEASQMNNEGLLPTGSLPSSEESTQACQNFVDFISLLPVNVTLKVFRIMEPKDLLKAAQTCHIWRFLAEDDVLWREKCKEAGLSDCLIPADHNVLSYRNKMNSSLQESLSRLNKQNFSFKYSPWKANFLKPHRIEMNFRRYLGKQKVLKGHKGFVITCFEIYDNKIASACRSIVKVWCAVSGKCLSTLIGHTNSVTSIQMDKNSVISGSVDRSIKVWNSNTGECLHTLLGHEGPVSCIQLHGVVVISGSHDNTLRLWDVQKGECLKTMTGHHGRVRSVHYNGRLVVSNGKDNAVKIWNPRNGECLRTLDGHSEFINSVKFDGDHVITGSLDRSVKVWNVETGVCKYIFTEYVPGNVDGEGDMKENLELQNNILVYTSVNNTIKIWNILTGTCLQTLINPDYERFWDYQSNDIGYIQFNEKFVVVTTDGFHGRVKLFDIKTGEFIRDLMEMYYGEMVPLIRMKDAKVVCTVLLRDDYKGLQDAELRVFNFDFDFNNLSFYK